MIHLASDPLSRRPGWRPAAPGRPSASATDPVSRATPSHAWPFLSRTAGRPTAQEHPVPPVSLSRRDSGSWVFPHRAPSCPSNPELPLPDAPRIRPATSRRWIAPSTPTSIAPVPGCTRAQTVRMSLHWCRDGRLPRPRLIRKLIGSI